MNTGVRVLLTRLRGEWERFRADDSGYTTEAVLATALLVSILLAAVAILAVKVIAKANGLSL